MKTRQRRLIGIIATIVFMICYVLVAMAIGGIWAVGKGAVIELVTFIVLGVAWLPAAMALVRWMSRPDVEG